MKIAGIQGGKNKGKAKQLDPELKALATLKDAVTVFADTYKDGKYMCFVTDAKVDPEIRVSPAGDKLRQFYDNNSYRATGSCCINFRDKVKDIMKSPRKADFTLVFKDSLDPLGLPDTKIDSYDFKLKL